MLVQFRSECAALGSAGPRARPAVSAASLEYRSRAAASLEYRSRAAACQRDNGVSVRRHSTLVEREREGGGGGREGWRQTDRYNAREKRREDKSGEKGI